jgi:hypothetical protein
LRWNISIVASIVLAVVLLPPGATAQGSPAEGTAEGFQPLTYPDRVVYSEGDSALWSEQGFDDSGWKDIWIAGLPAEKTNYWIRNHVTLINSDTAMPYDHAIEVGILGSYEIYWDGIPIGHNGIIGDSSESEIPGTIGKVFRVPSSLYRPGEHVVSLRVSSYHSQDELRSRHYHFFIGPHEAFLKHGYQANILPLMMQGGIIIIGLYYLIMYGFYQRKSPVLVFSLLCFAMALLIFVESYRDLFNYSYQWHWHRMIFVLGLSGTVSLLLITFCMKRFDLPKLVPIAAVTTALMILLATLDIGFDYRSYLVFAIGLICSLGIVGVARWQGKAGAGLTLAGLAITAAMMLLLPGQFMDKYLFLSFGILALFILGSLTQSLRKQQQEHDAAIINSSRLEIELLKKNIQPHFILNTLTAVEEWIEESPATAIKFIDALADEFRIMSKMAHEKLVPLAQELDLCESHLKIMSYRKNVDFRLSAVIGDPVDIPPAIFHTLIENAITHNNYREGIIEFKLRQELSDGHLRFVFSSPGIARKLDSRKENQTRGTGLKYIRARLEESFAGSWQLEETQSADEWVTAITIPMDVLAHSAGEPVHA